ncbi:MAG: histidinol-phosphate transaminase [Chloroflexota bacterium]
MKWQKLIRSNILAMEAYEPVMPLANLAEQTGQPVTAFVRLNANENPYGPSPKAATAVAEAQYLHQYPDPEARQLRRGLSMVTGVPEETLLVGAGADELIDLTARAIIAPGDSIIDCPPSFGMYPATSAINGARIINVPRDGDFSLDVTAIEAAAENSQAKLLFLCSPNNPDGSYIDDQTLRRLLRLPLLVLLDEAYVEFAIAGANGLDSRMTWTTQYENLVVLRTFSKVAGLAGLRLGYGAYPAWLAAQLWKIKQPYNINAVAAAAGVAALADGDWLGEKAALLVAERDRLAACLQEFDFLQPYPSQANFVLCKVIGRDARNLRDGLAQQGILIRYFAKPGLEQCIRISAGKPDDTDRLIEALHNVEA